MATSTTVHVIPARSAPIDDRMLHHIRNIAHDARRGDVTEAEAELMLGTVGPLLDELVNWRTLAAGHVPAGATVTLLPVAS